ncbi:hypothetical protein E2C01_046691 [Portunus trituberculatus]|uniref:Uncharacterized protein n=1 Tax=Portunus trituberculatus TaxID=210409 RepID=A0A5B7G6D4_PORTR|nr:hypothetical protein [Portunus trituberculatus]
MTKGTWDLLLTTRMLTLIK